MLGQLRSKTKPLAFTLAKPFAALHLHPNLVSFFGIPLILVAGYFIYHSNYLPAAVFTLLAITMDFIDGAVAELTKKKSYFGNYFETMMDKYVEMILLASFAFHFPVESVFALAFSFMESYAKPRVALVIITDNRDWPAIGEHADKFVLIISFLFIAAFFPVILGIETLRLMLWLLIIMTLIGGAQRMLYAKKLIEEAERKGKILPYLKKDAGHKAIE
ncbi:MAG: CDP-alcohol phosphatidyltransferase family protein [Candidatus Diapherotrites archaeon]|nr:CDP-alcohol phosphatidyltransferase family protein [Candidatus Diapherotrites archaeon]